MSLDDTSNAAVQRALFRAVRNDLKANYEAEDADALDNAAGEILAAGASLDAAGKIHYTQAALRIAPKLAPARTAKGNSTEAKLERSEEITRRAGPLRKGVSVADARAAIAKLGALPQNATDEQKILRASAVLAALTAGGVTGESPDGD